MLQCQDSRRHQHSHLLAIGCRLECSTNGDLGLTEAHIATDEAIHRSRRLHIALDSLRSLELIGRILPLERSLQSLLQIAVGREGKALTRLALGIECNEFTRDILDRLLGGILNLLPRSAT